MWGVSAEDEPSLFHTFPLQKLKLLCLITLFTMFLLILWLHGKKWETQVQLVIIEGKKSVTVSDLLLPCKGSGTLIFGPVRFARIFLVYNELKMVGLFWSHVCVNQENFEVCLRLKPVWLWWDPNSWCFCKRCVRSICLCCRTWVAMAGARTTSCRSLHPPFLFSIWLCTHPLTKCLKGAEAAAEALLTFSLLSNLNGQTVTLVEWLVMK